MIFSGLCLGLRGAGRLRDREELLLDLQRVIQDLRTGVAYSARPLAELVALETGSRFCRLAVEDSAFPQDTKSALAHAGEALLKTPSDLEMYQNFVRGLGESGAQGQLEHLALCGELLASHLRSAREEREKKARLSICLGLFGGVVICLVLL